MMLFRTPKILQKIYPSLTWEFPTDEKEIRLTFDDGPIPEVTEFVLETLQKYNAKATFFCIGNNIKKHPAVFQKILADGHSIGNHTMHHLKGWKTQNHKYLEDVNDCEKEIEKYYLSQNKKIFRPPYGRITRSQIASLSDFEIIMWTVLSQDYRQALSTERCLNETIRATKPGSIVLFHDSLKAEKNLTFVLPRFLETLSMSGYKFLAI